jgi:hypothetical protein
MINCNMAEETKTQICEWCKHPASEHHLENAGACGDPECCGSEYEWCYVCDDYCSGCDLKRNW